MFAQKQEPVDIYRTFLLKLILPFYCWYCITTNCQHKHYLLEYFLKKISTHQKMLKITTFMFYFAGIIHSFKIKPTFWGGNYFVKLNLVCNSLKSHKFNHNFVTSTFKSNFEASYIIFYGS